MFFRRCLKGAESNATQSRSSTEAEVNLKVAVVLEKIQSIANSDFDNYVDSMLVNELDKLLLQMAMLELRSLVLNQIQKIITINGKNGVADMFISTYQELNPINMDERMESMEQFKNTLNSEHKPLMTDLPNKIARLNPLLKKFGQEEINLEDYGIKSSNKDNSNNNASIFPKR